MRMTTRDLLTERDRKALERFIGSKFKSDPELVHVLAKVVPDERGEAVVCLLEASEAMYDTGFIEPYGFAPTRDVPFRTAIALISPDEYVAFRRDARSLKHPKGWDFRTFDAEWHRREAS